MSRECIVCGKPIAKKTTSWQVKLAREARAATYRKVAGRDILDLPAVDAKPAGLIEQNFAHAYTCYVNELPRSREELARFTNQEIVSITRSYDGRTISGFSTWDGVSYVDEFFHAKACAVKQGYAAARDGLRWVWKDSQ